MKFWKWSLNRAHPRSRGEHFLQADDMRRLPGSSPLTRGALGADTNGLASDRLIPAHAGSTANWYKFDTADTAHPRSRGEHLEAAKDHLKQMGSSPLTRGAPTLVEPMRGIGGLIPAHAGSTAQRTCAQTASPAHPRSRGEHYGLGYADYALHGSSPLTRGALSVAGRAERLQGLIPAHAGSTCIATPGKSARRAHPRSRGEHGDVVVGAVPHEGSSPLTRGALGRFGWCGRHAGLIPAHAGSTA